jgi:hypothetical protein
MGKNDSLIYGHAATYKTISEKISNIGQIVFELYKNLSNMR